VSPGISPDKFVCPSAEAEEREGEEGEANSEDAEEASKDDAECSCM
jgi:hypothetical protein